MKVQPFFLFLLRDGRNPTHSLVKSFSLFTIFIFSGTVISINSTPDHDFTAPILARLKQRDTSLRTTADASLLVQSLLDLGDEARL